MHACSEGAKSSFPRDDARLADDSGSIFPAALKKMESECIPRSGYSAGTNNRHRKCIPSRAAILFELIHSDHQNVDNGPLESYPQQR